MQECELSSGFEGSAFEWVIVASHVLRDASPWRGRGGGSTRRRQELSKPLIFILSLSQGEASADLEPYLHRAQYPVAGWPRNPFKLCDFPLVTQISVLY